MMDTFGVLHVNMETEALVAGGNLDLFSSSVVAPQGYILVLSLSPHGSSMCSCSLKFGVQF